MKRTSVYFPIVPEGRNERCSSTEESQQQNINRFVFNLHVIIWVIVRAGAPPPFIFSMSHPARFFFEVFFFFLVVYNRPVFAVECFIA